MKAVSWLALTKVVVRLEPLTCTTEALVNLVPLTVRVKAWPPLATVLGLSEVMVGGDGLTVKALGRVPTAPLLVVTVTLRGPGVAVGEIEMLARSWLLDKKLTV
jgi:hypothetical protein